MNVNLNLAESCHVFFGYCSPDHGLCITVCTGSFDCVLQLVVAEKTQNLRRLEAQRNELNAKGDQQLCFYQSFEIFHILHFTDFSFVVPVKARRVVVDVAH